MRLLAGCVYDQHAPVFYLILKTARMGGFKFECKINYFFFRMGKPVRALSMTL